MLDISVKNLSKRYPRYKHPQDRLKEIFILKKKNYHEDFWALKNVSFDVPRGTTLGIVGQNGSGKSTLLQIIAGILKPSEGEIQVNGKVSSLLELGAGFHPEFTGRENVFMNGAIMGFSQKEVEERFEEIAAFAEIGDFLDQPVKTYSSGMFVRLAFATAVSVDPDILLIDEALSVGDMYFQHRCMHKMRQFQERGKTILFVSHDIETVKSLCHRAILLNNGKLILDGDPEVVTNFYFASCFEKKKNLIVKESEETNIVVEEKTPPEISSDLAGEEVIYEIPNVDQRHGDKKAEVIGIIVFNERGDKTCQVYPGEKIIIRISVRFNTDIQKPIIGFMLRDKKGMDITGTNTSHNNSTLPPARKGEVFSVDFSFRFPYLKADTYTISPAVAYGTLEDHIYADHIINALVIEVIPTTTIYGYIRLPIISKLSYKGNGQLSNLV
jgi:ABC-type polysaccharide/polyol phosphate transport system ATPase subunit